MGILTERIEGSKISVDINSSNLKAAAYDTSTQRMVVVFKNGSEYEYDAVPWEIFTKFRMSESQGKFFNANISKHYKYKKVK